MSAASNRTIGTFTCACCGETFEKGWTDEEASAELKETFPGIERPHCELVCDPCFEAICKFHGIKPKRGEPTP